VQRCSLNGNDSVSGAIYATCMSMCMNGPSQPPPPPDVWGAIAVSPSTLTEGHAWNFKSEQDASKRALKECQGATKAADCKIVVTVADVCVSLAASKPEKVYAGSSPSPGITFANNNAMLHCQRAGGRSCAVLTSFCADGIRHEARDGRVLRR
jgi:hypothetical protein